MINDDDTGGDDGDNHGRDGEAGDDQVSLNVGMDSRFVACLQAALRTVLAVLCIY